MTTANLRIVPRNFHDEATLSVSAAALTGCTAQNTQDVIRSRFWQTTSGADQYMLGTFADGLARTFSYFGIFRHRCHGGSVQLQLYSDAAWTTLVYDSSALAVINVTPTDGADWGVNPYGTGVLDPYLLEAPYWLWFSPTSCLSYKITFTGNVSTYGAAYWQVCRFFLGNHIEMTINPAHGVALGFVDLTDRNRSQGGSLRTNVGPIWRAMQMDMSWMYEAQRAAMLDLQRRAGTGRDIVVSLYPDDATRLERDNHMNCKFSSLNAIGRQVAWLTTKFQFEEV